MYRYLVFAGERYYPSGGWRDLRGTADTLEAAKAIVNMPEPSVADWALEDTQPDWCQIVDTTTGRIVVFYRNGEWECD